ncbi:MalY/PatB family protein [Paenibacillus aestuarii]|uniref:cysteine-S-conjugate beta-lyase n=1 Tax=Paenibacillus aestuarii TaxID=516965 RepID=A0ABW0KDQ0_9BACL|nr:pyridoxal phosphate-dependent aminotransferase [Paenibacillus aestuarii]
MKYNFDTVIRREGTNSVKWDPAILKKIFGIEGDNILPLWVADMDFAVPQSVTDALQKRVEHGIFGYCAPLDDYYSALAWWQQVRHNWTIKQEWVTITPGIVPALNFIIRALTDEEDQIIIQQPVYHPFHSTVTTNNRVVVNNPLIWENGTYVIDYDHLESLAKQPKTKMMILCSPHNPLGIVWSYEQLHRLGEICSRNGVIVVADEIHNDLILPGNLHTTYARLGEEFADHAVICTAPSKTFNLAGLQTSNLIIPNKSLKEKIDSEFKKSSISGANLFGIVATTAAYTPEGAEWLDQLLGYLDANADFIQAFVQDKMPGVTYVKPEATYLAWLDFRKSDIDIEQLDSRIKEAKVLLNSGASFGAGGEGFMRLNFACSRTILEEALMRLANMLALK